MFIFVTNIQYLNIIRKHFFKFLWIVIILILRDMMKRIIILLLLVISPNLWGKEWVIKLPLDKVYVFSSDTLRHPSWYSVKYKLRNMINLSFFTTKSAVPPFKNHDRFNPNNTHLWPFVSIDDPHEFGIPNLRTHIHFSDHTGVPAIWSKYIFAGTPLLLKDSIPQKIYHNKFTLARRPRTVFGSHHPDSIFIYISSGIRIVDLPKRLLELGCRDAINMDGGGSTFLYQGNKYEYVQQPIKKMRKYPNILGW
jgi:hypothetical protein